MFKSILVPVDGSARSVEAVEFAHTLAVDTHASVTLLHVEPWGASAEDARRDHVDLDALVERLRADGVDAHAVLRFDEPEDGIAATAALENADLIVLAPHLRDGLDALTHPSVTARMLAHSSAPLLIYPDAMPYIGATPLLADPAQRILVPLDGSQRAEAALPLAMELARHFDHELLLVRAAAPTTYVIGPEVYVPTSEAVTAHRQEVEDYLASVAAHVKAAGLRARTMALAGAPGAELTALLAPEHVGLVVFCTHGRTGAARLMLGSVARHLIHHATTPLLVLPPRYVASLGAATITQETTAG